MNTTDRLSPTTVHAFPALRALAKVEQTIIYYDTPRFIEAGDFDPSAVMPQQGRFLAFGQIADYDRICFDLLDGDAVVGLDFNYGSPYRFNSSLERYVACRLKEKELYQRWWAERGARSVSVAEAKRDGAEMRAALEAIDPGCVESGGFWAVIVEQLEEGLL